MNVDEIKKAVNEGKTVCWSHDGYQVIKDDIGDYLIIYLDNGYCNGLTYQDNITLNGDEEEFYIKKGETR